MATAAADDEAAGTEGAAQTDADAAHRLEDAARRIFVGNLPWAWTEEDVRRIVEDVGEVLNVELQRHADSGRSKGWALVQLSSPEIAAAACQRLHGSRVPDSSDGNGGGEDAPARESHRVLQVRRDQTYLDSLSHHVVYIGNLPFSVDDAGLLNVVRDYGPVSATVKSTMTGRSRGFGLVAFRTREDAQRAIDGLAETVVGERTLDVRWDRGPGKASVMQGRVLYVAGLDGSVDEEQIAAVFGIVGTITAVRVRKNAAGVSKRWCTIEYETEAEAQEAISRLHDSSELAAPGRTLVVRISTK